MFKVFTRFLMPGQQPTRRDLIDLGTILVIGFVISVLVGGALAAVVTALIKDLLIPLMAAIIGRLDLSAINFTVHGSRFMIGDLINAVISFVLITAAVSLVVMIPVRAILARARRGEAQLGTTTKQCPECLSTIAIQARRCAFCTSPVSTR